MNSGDFIKIYDLLDVGFRNWWFSAFGSWFSSLFIIVYYLDLFFILTMPIGYFQRFFSIEKLDVEHAAIPSWLIKNKKIEMRQTLLFWDPMTRTIWLRPRGFNIFRASHVVGKLTTDKAGTMIIRQETVLSPGAILTAVLFMFSAVQLFSGRLQEGAPSPPIVFTPVIFVFMCLGLYQGRRQMADRMEKLMEETVHQLIHEKKGA